MYIRRMTKQDVQEVTRIEQSLLECPWTTKIFEECLKYYYCFIVQESEEKTEIIGYAILAIIIDESHLLNLAIKKQNQKKGLGQKLMQHLLEFAKNKKTNIMFLEVRKSNLPAKRLYNKLGFSQLGVRKDYYLTSNGNKEDAFVLSKKTV